MMQSHLFQQIIIILISYFGISVVEGSKQSWPYPLVEFCFYSNSDLPVLNRVCSPEPPTAGCYFNVVTNYTGVAQNTIINDGQGPPKILICGGRIPDWVTKTCFWVDGGTHFLCGLKNKPLWNMRAKVDPHLVDVGTLNLEEDLWKPMRAAVHDLHLAHDVVKETAGPGCSHDKKGSVAVRGSMYGSFSTLNDPDGKSSPVMFDQDFVTKWLLDSIERIVNSIKDAFAYPVFINCESQPYGGYTTETCVGDACQSIIENGCGYKYQSEDTARHPCPCEGRNPCKSNRTGYYLPAAIEAQIYDKDTIWDPVSLKLTFDMRYPDGTCELTERLAVVLPGFFPFLGLKQQNCIHQVADDRNCARHVHPHAIVNRLRHQVPTKTE